MAFNNERKPGLKQRALKRLTAALVVSLGHFAIDSYAEKTPIDLLLHNGTVFTGADAIEPVSAIAVHHGKIIALGDHSLINLYQPNKKIDLGCRFIMPGFNDSHLHLEGQSSRYIDLNKVTSVSEIMRLVTAKAENLGDGEWITGYGWSEDALAEGRKPTKTDLDIAAPNNPVVLTRAGAHSAVASSTALKLAGITAASPNPEGGVFEKNAAGKLTGIIRERHGLVTSLVPPPSDAEIQASLKTQVRALFELGITSYTNASTDPRELAQFAGIYSDGSTLPRGSLQLLWQGDNTLALYRDFASQEPSRLRLGAVKIFADGGFTGPAAFTTKPYKGEATYRGSLNMPKSELQNAISVAHGAGLQLGVHAIGDAAIDLAADLIAAALESTPRDDHRHYLNHFSMMPSTATMQKMGRMGIAISQQPNFTYTLEGRYNAYLDGKRLQHNNPLRSPMDNGIRLAISSDILPLDPIVGIYAAVTRRGMSGAVYGIAEALSVSEALKAYTAEAAYLNFRETELGFIAPGYRADMVVLSDNPTTMNPDQLLELSVAHTFFNGELVYSSSSQQPTQCLTN